jgi:hypothetical protein
MQRIANPWTSVRLREAPPFFLTLCLQEEISKKNKIAILAQLVERNLAKVEVIGSNPMYRSKLFRYGNYDILMLKALTKNQRKLVFLYLKINKFTSLQWFIT